MLKVGVAGLRRGWGLLHTFHNHRDAEVVAVCDQAAELRQKASAEFGIEAGYADFAEMLVADLDVVVVATPVPLHAGQSIAAMEAGAHVLSEGTGRPDPGRVRGAGGNCKADGADLYDG